MKYQDVIHASEQSVSHKRFVAAVERDLNRLTHVLGISNVRYGMLRGAAKPALRVFGVRWLSAPRRATQFEQTWLVTQRWAEDCIDTGDPSALVTRSVLAELAGCIIVAHAFNGVHVARQFLSNVDPFVDCKLKDVPRQALGRTALFVIAAEAYSTDGLSSGELMTWLNRVGMQVQDRHVTHDEVVRAFTETTWPYVEELIKNVRQVMG